MRLEDLDAAKSGGGNRGKEGKQVLRSPLRRPSRRLDGDGVKEDIHGYSAGAPDESGT